MITYIKWYCPKCGTLNDDDLDPILGPFVTCTCGGCGKAFDQVEVNGVYHDEEGNP